MEWVPDEGRVLDFSNPFITYIYLLFYSMALVAFLFFLSTFFNNREYFVLITINEFIRCFHQFVLPINFFDRDFTSWSWELFFFSFQPIYFFQFLLGLFFPFSLCTFISLFLFFFGLFLPFLFGLLFNRGHILDFFQFFFHEFFSV